MSTTEKLYRELQSKYPNSHTSAIFCDVMHIDTSNIAEVAKAIPIVKRMAKFYKWHESPSDACRTFCNLCFIDPMLVEAYMGMTFEEV